MTEEEFNKLMIKTDKELAAKGIAATGRMFFAPKVINPSLQTIYPGQQVDPNLGLYEGNNLFHAISDWYEKHYWNQMTIKEFSRRPIIIRGEVFTILIPTIFNPSEEIPVRKHIANLSDELWAILDDNEKKAIQVKFNQMFREISSLQLFVSSIKEIPSPNIKLASDLIVRGQTDLISATYSFLPTDPHASMWNCQQAVEKFLKAFLAISDRKINVENLKKFRHNNIQLLEEAILQNNSFEQVRPHISKVAFTPQDRYKVCQISREEAVYIINLSFAICNLVAQILLPLRKQKI